MPRKAGAPPRPLLINTFPRLVAEWDAAKNINLPPLALISSGSNRAAWWKCTTNPAHRWQARISRRTSSIRPSGCPDCKKRRVNIHTCLRSTHPEVAAEWHGELNGDLTPDKVVSGSLKRAWWQCRHDSKHKWQARISSRCGERQHYGCPFCSGRFATDENNVRDCWPLLAAQWHPTLNGTLSPRDFTLRSGKKIWWQCPKKSAHNWLATVSNRAMGGRDGKGTGCPYCDNQKICADNNLAYTHPDLATQWHPTKNGTLLPTQIASGTNRKIWWQCPRVPGHSWLTRASDRLRGQGGCPNCALHTQSKQELRIKAELSPFLAIDASVKVVAGRTRKYYVDIVCPASKLILEFDGSYFHRDTFDRDKKKADDLRSRGWTVIRIREGTLPLTSPDDIQVPLRNVKEQINAVLLHLATKGFVPLPEVQKYVAQNNLQETQKADEWISAGTYRGDNQETKRSTASPRPAVSPSARLAKRPRRRKHILNSKYQLELFDLENKAASDFTRSIFVQPGTAPMLKKDLSLSLSEASPSPVLAPGSN